MTYFVGPLLSQPLNTSVIFGPFPDPAPQKGYGFFVKGGTAKGHARANTAIIHMGAVQLHDHIAFVRITGGDQLEITLLGRFANQAVKGSSGMKRQITCLFACQVTNSAFPA